MDQPYYVIRHERPREMTCLVYHTSDGFIGEIKDLVLAYKIIDLLNAAELQVTRKLKAASAGTPST